MKLGPLGLWALGWALAVGACSGDAKQAANAAGASSGGTAANGGGSGAGASTQAGTGNIAGSGANAAGGSGGSGGSGGTGGVNGVGGAAGATDGGAVDGGAAAGGAGDDEPTTPLTTRWLAYTHTKGAFVYDLQQFPADTGSTQVGTYGDLYWSPNGRRLLSFNAGDWSVRDLSGATPGAAVLIASQPKGVDPPIAAKAAQFAWSGDSRSLATVSVTTLSVLDPSQTTPALHAVTTTLKSYRWAPSGKRLLYVDASGSHVVEVDTGVPGAPQDVDASAQTWSPNGADLAGPNGGDLMLTRLGGATPQLITLTQPTIADPWITNWSFAPDGSTIAIGGGQDRVANDVYYVKLGATPAAPKRVHPALADADIAFSGPWSPDGKWLIYYVEGTGAPGQYGVDLSGSSPKSPVQLNAPVTGTPAWSPLGRTVMSISTIGTRTLFALDLLQPAATPLTLYAGSDLASAKLSPSGLISAYSTTTALHFVQVAAPPDAQNLPLDAASGNVSSYEWSPDSHFVAYVADSARQLRLTSVTGITPSAPVYLQGKSTLGMLYAWQP